jgi:lipopolysaccharide export system permease protein
MKTFDRYLVGSFIKPFLATFLVMVFFLLMQFIWKYLEDLAGKGIEWYYIAELLFFVSATVIPLALPLSVLLASLMTFGAFGENNELAAMKSAGISLMQGMRPLIVLMVAISIGAFLFSNYVIPVAQLKAESLMQNITKLKPSLNLREGVFNNDIEGYSIRIGSKAGEDKQDLMDVLIYDHTARNGNTEVISARSGRMDLSPDEKFLILTLNNGVQYEETPEDRKRGTRMPFIKNKFDKLVIRFDLSGRNTADLREETTKDYSMMTIFQLVDTRDSLDGFLDGRQGEIYRSVSSKYAMEYGPDTAQVGAVKPVLIETVSPLRRSIVIQNALRLSRSQRALFEQVKAEFDWRIRILARYQIEWHRKFTLSFACMILFFIGAPLGAIIRKGGLGLPLVVAVIIFLVFHVTSFTLERLARELLLTPLAGMWLPSMILLPFGIFLTYKSTTDSALFNTEFYLLPFRKLSQWFTARWAKP